jgi:transmembrane sensor
MKEGENKNSESMEDRMSLQATKWTSKRDQGFSPEDQDAFFEWLAQDPRHKEMFNKRAGLWEEMNLLGDWRPEHSLKPNPDLLAVRKSSSKKPRIMVFCAVTLAFFIGTVAVHQWTQSTNRGTLMLAFGGAQDYESHVLDDDSVVELNRGAQVSVQYTKKVRMIFLHTGEAHFTVAKDPGRPFVVRAGGTLVEATGTAFNVSLKENGIEVIVTEGRVLLHSATAPESESTDMTIETVGLELVAGQRSFVSGVNTTQDAPIDLVSYEEIDRKLAWKGEVLDFEDVPLFEVANEFNRHNRTKIQIADEKLGNLKITAKLRSSNLDGFVELLKITENIQASRDELSNIILKRGIDDSSQ